MRSQTLLVLGLLLFVFPIFGQDPIIFPPQTLPDPELVADFPSRFSILSFKKSDTHYFLLNKERQAFERPINGSTPWEEIDFRYWIWQDRNDDAFYWSDLTMTCTPTQMATNFNSTITLYKTTGAIKDSIPVYSRSAGNTGHYPWDFRIYSLDSNALFLENKLNTFIANTVSLNNGQSWMQVNISNNEQFYPSKLGNHYIIRQKDSLFISSTPDFGQKSLLQLPVNLNAVSIELLWANNQIVLANGTDLYTSSDLGLTWDTVIFPSSIQKMLFVNQTYFLQSNGKLYKTAQLGAPLTEVIFQNYLNAEVHDFELTGTDEMIVTLDAIGMMLSQDGGTSWQHFNEGLPRTALDYLGMVNNKLVGTNDYTLVHETSPDAWNLFTDPIGQQKEGQLHIAQNTAFLLSTKTPNQAQISISDDLIGFSACDTISAPFNIAHLKAFQSDSLPYVDTGDKYTQNSIDCKEKRSINRANLPLPDAPIMAFGDTIILKNYMDSTIKVSIDYGLSWQTRAIPVPLHNYHFLIYKNNQLYLIGSNFSCAISSDLGQTWQLVSIPASNIPSQGINIYFTLDDYIVSLKNFEFHITTDPSVGWLPVPALDSSFNWVFRNEDLYFTKYGIGLFKVDVTNLFSTLNQFSAVEEPNISHPFIIELTPNPVLDELRLKINQPESISHLILKTIDGKVIEVKHDIKSHESLNVNGLTQGVYFLTIVNWQGQIQTRKFIKM